MKYTYWSCKLHECGSFKFNHVMRPEMPWCEIVKGYTRPNGNKTWYNPEIGGLNGDISRKFFPDWDKFCLEKQQKLLRKDQWVRQVQANDANVDYHTQKYRKFVEELD